MRLTNRIAPGGVGGWELVGEGTAITEDLASGTYQDPVVDPVANAHADAQQLALAHAEEGAVLDEHQQALT